ncbi:MAG: helix-turn-helix transcriptional regulator [Christensenellales bacterium]
MKSSVVSGESRGSVNEILLKALQSGDKYGYEINKEIETKSGGKFFLKEASLYSGLKRLQASGFISSYWQDGELGIRRHYYSITQKGLEKLNSSNFTWDSSKEFLDEMFKNEKANKIQPSNRPNLMQSEKETVDTTLSITQNAQQANTEQNSEKEFKKNPFQIEVSPLQQSFFDFSSNLTQSEDVFNKSESNVENQIENQKEENQKESVETTNSDNEILNEEKAESCENFSEQINAITDDKLEKDCEIKQAQENQTESLSYEKLICDYANKDYTTSLQKENVVDISQLLKQNININDSSIVFDNKYSQSAGQNEDSKNVDKNEFVEQPTLQNQQNFASPTNQENLAENVDALNETGILENDKNFVQHTENKVDFKNIFGSLLVGNSESDETEKSVDTNLIDNRCEQEQQNSNESQNETKPELPRINVDNDVNVMLKSDKKSSYDYTANNVKSTNFEDKIVQPISGNVPSVKQYINNVHKQTLISRATNVTEEVNLEGINIREYSKMNNKLIRNSNYVYSNKLNFVLALIISSLLLIESVVSFIVLNKIGSLQTFEIIFFITTILLSLINAYIFTYRFVKDKFKVELRNYNFKSQIFYFILIFVVCLILILCVNIFAGMNSNNLFDFAMKIVFESLVTLNLIAYPVLKLCLYKLRYFSN